MAKKVLINAYMEGNLGDDLMIWRLPKRYPKVIFQVFTHPEYKERYKAVKNIKVYSAQDRYVKWAEQYWKRKTHGQEDFYLMKMRKADALVQIGGSIFPQNHIWELVYLFNLKYREICEKVFVCGANFGPYKDEDFVERYRDLFERTESVCLRDRHSYQLFSDIPTVRYAPDLVFGYEPSEDRQIRQKKQVLISVIQMKDRDGDFAINGYYDAYMKFMSKLTEKYVDSGYEIRFVCFCKDQGDYEAAKEIEAGLPEEKRKKISHYIYEYDIEEAVAQFEECEIVIGTRFHSIILGWLKGKKVLPIVYDQKTLHTLEDCSMQNFVRLEDLKYADVEEITEKIEAFPEILREKYVKDAQIHFEKLDCFLGK